MTTTDPTTVTPAMTGPEHYAEAERLLSAAENEYASADLDARAQQVARAGVHAQLATCAAAVDRVQAGAGPQWRAVVPYPFPVEQDES